MTLAGLAEVGPAVPRRGGGEKKGDAALENALENALEKVAELLDERTGGRHAAQIEKGREFDGELIGGTQGRQRSHR